MTTIGKYRHFSRVANEQGHFVVMAIDHRTNLLEKLNHYTDAPLTDEDFMAFKHDVIKALMPHASAILADPSYGITKGVAEATITGQYGLLAPIEVTDYGLHPSQRRMQSIPNWSVKKIKMMGGDGVKSLLPYHPDADNVQEKENFVQSIIDDCTEFDVPFFLEPIPYALDPTATLSNKELLSISVTMCEKFSAMGVDCLKLPFPVNHKQSQGESEWREACEAITEACSVPWALLSAGVDFETFLKQSEIACKAGASGVIVGRAVWAEAVELQGDARHDFLENTASHRMQQLAQVCEQHATAWHTKVSPPDTSLTWYESYQ
ncbi:MAG: tagatose 1,6-diphosphate aldolase [Chloroflexota bacterium]